MNRDTARWILDSIATIAAVTSTVAIVILRQPQRAAARPELPKDPIALSDRPFVGDSHARIGILVFSDFECPFCARFATEVWPVLRGEYIETGKVRAVFSHLPLTRIHPEALRAARLATCAGAQGRFWEFHDALFLLGGKLDNTGFASAEHTVGLDPVSLEQCASSKDALARVNTDIDVAKALGLGSTPVIMIGRVDEINQLHVSQMVLGARDIDAFRHAIDVIPIANHKS